MFEGEHMFNSDFLEKIFANSQMQHIPFGAQSTAVKAFEEVFEDILEVNPYATLSELVYATGNESISTEF